MGTVRYISVDPNHPFMGLNNKNCQNPKHWCKDHRVWLSDEDLEHRHCLCKCSDGGTCRCDALMENCYEENIFFLIRKTRVSRRKGGKNYY